MWLSPSPEDRKAIAAQVYAAWELDPAVPAVSGTVHVGCPQTGNPRLAEAKTFPWPNCSNVKFPLITIAALQFHAQPIHLSSLVPDVVKCRIYAVILKGSGLHRHSRSPST